MVKYDPKVIEDKWRKRWAEAHIFEPKVDETKKKFFLTVPVPYPDGYIHLGHIYTWTRPDVYARFMRMRGYNVLFPQGFHFTGGPAASISFRIRNNDQSVIDRFKKQGIPMEMIKKFGEDPINMTLFFSNTFRDDFDSMGISIDWRRLFMLSYTKSYSKFVQWQFEKLREKGLITQGTHPVIWCPAENTPLGDHDRSVGEGETPLKFNIIKFKIDNYILPVATLRPETIYGVTNIWVNPAINYKEIVLENGEHWIASEEFEKKLPYQLKKIVSSNPFNIEKIIFSSVLNPVSKQKIPILPADFVDKNTATGIVMSVPMHDPFDYIYYERIKSENPEFYTEPKAVIDTDSKNIVKEAIEKFGKKKLEEAERFVYNKEILSGTMNKNSGELAGMNVKDARNKIEEKLKSMKVLDEFYEPSGEVICRCGARGIVKVLENQWFIDYSNKEWKEKTLNHLLSMQIFPEQARSQLADAIVNMTEKAAVRQGGLGTPLPWDPNWLIEPLSDSTIYMAFYTISHLIKNIDDKYVNNELFDYIFADGAPPKHIDKALLEEMRREFNYWYPVDIRSSAKDLIPHHLSFYIFNHVAMFPPDKWPRGIMVNGWIVLNGQKLSKSKGAAPIGELMKSYGADELRLVASAADGLDNADWNTENIKGFDDRINFLLDIIEILGGIKGESKIIDNYLISKFNKIIKEVTNDISEARLRSALYHAFFESISLLKFYLEFGGNNQEIVKKVMNIIIRLNHPFFPFITEEMNEKLGNDKLLESFTSWPEPSDEIYDTIENEVEVFRNTIDDISNLIRLLKKKPAEIIIRIAEKDRFDVYNKLVERVKIDRNIAEIKDEFGKFEFLKTYIRNPNKLPVSLLDGELERSVFIEGKDYLEKLFGSSVKIELSKDVKAIPGKPGIEIR